MIGAGTGLTPVSTAALEQLLRATHRGEVRFPLDIGELTRHGLQYCASELLHALRGCGDDTVKAVLVNVLAERKAHARGDHPHPR